MILFHHLISEITRLPESASFTWKQKGSDNVRSVPKTSRIFARSKAKVLSKTWVAGEKHSKAWSDSLHHRFIDLTWTQTSGDFCSWRSSHKILIQINWIILRGVPAEWAERNCEIDSIAASQFDWNVFEKHYVAARRPLLIRGGEVGLWICIKPSNPPSTEAYQAVSGLRPIAFHVTANCVVQEWGWVSVTGSSSQKKLFLMSQVFEQFEHSQRLTRETFVMYLLWKCPWRTIQHFWISEIHRIKSARISATSSNACRMMKALWALQEVLLSYSKIKFYYAQRSLPLVASLWEVPWLWNALKYCICLWGTLAISSISAISWWSFPSLALILW